MSLSGFRKRGEQPQEPERDESRCAANGCPCRGTVSLEGGRFVCTAHSAVPSDRWPLVTERQTEFRWLVEFIDEMQKMDRQRQDWRGFAKQFWEESEPACMPHERENAAPYQLRMRAELLFRCGVLTKRPEPRLPKEFTGRFGNVAGLAREAE